MKRLLIITALAMTLLSAAVVSAQDDTTREGRRHFRRGAALEQITEITGLDRQAIFEGFQNGQTLAETITANGGDVSAVEQALTDALNELPNSENRDVAAAVDRILNTVPEHDGRPGKHDFPRARRLMEEVSEITGLDRETIIAGFQNGQTLAETITANGGDVSAVEQALTDKLNELPNSENRDIEAAVDRILNTVPERSFKQSDVPSDTDAAPDADA